MRIQYENGDEIILRRVNEMDESEWEEPGEYAALIAAQQNGDTFTITCEACDGYYDIINDTTGMEFDAISSYHFLPNLDGIQLKTMLDL